MVYVTLILTFATGGRLATTIDHLIVQVFVFGLFVMQLAVMLFLPADGNLLLAHDPWPGVEFANGVQLPSNEPGLGVRALAGVGGADGGSAPEGTV